MQQKRFLLAITISALILFGWNFLFPPPKSPQQNNANNSAEQPAPQASADAGQSNNAATPAPTAQEQSAQANNNATPPAQQDTTPARTITVTSPYYKVELDNRGAVAKSWVITKIINLENNDPGKARDVFSVGGHKQPLELIPAESLRNNQAPLKLVTGDQNADETLSNRNYKVTVDGKETEENSVQVSAGASKQVAFNLRDEATGLDVVKTITFYPDRYITDIQVQLKRNEQQVPQAKLLIGPSIGDQGIPSYSFYSVAPEGIAFAGGKTERLYGQTLNENKESPDKKAVPGPVSWAGVGDTYFVMLAVPSKQTEGLEYRTSKYEHQANGTKEARYLITGFVPVPTDNSATRLYVGPKDHYLLTAASEQLGKEGTKIDLEESIDYGFLSTLSRPLAVPILWSIKKLYQITGSYGLAIILFTIVIYSLFFPLKWRSSKAMKKAAKMAPRMKELQEKIKGMKQDDPKLKELQMEQLRLMKEGNPLGGCLPLLI
ncbi:MAG: membrane protein insertase YidC, partial [Acidobacteria bacterium]|nr:membrane protein insertase YidC [Acidobacteriota bacterium]